MEFHKELTHLLEAKRLLDDILTYREIYTCNFNIPPHEQYDNESLRSRMDTYMGLDDSE